MIICRSNVDCVIGVAAGVAVVFWLRDTNIEDVEQLAKAARLAQRGSNEPVRLIQVLPQTASTPDTRARSALAHMLRSLQGVVSHSVVLYEGEGFRASMVRSIATSVTSLSNPGFPHRVFGRLPEAVDWMCDGEAEASARHIEEAVQGVRKAIAGGKAAERRSSGPSLAAQPR